ncbi:MAG: enoyl-ACP reductase [Gammaproteobacteria bacterium]|nr:enoyl-ACP reductase [Gammaproteobacteria bacterium]MBU1558840.1 enoyl-ACP reductase [Gammaproteobacteria bacterium]MBU1628798.1 enoyl-ACP reductase [Gammaproteobacteria bacterium]MBU2546074.1 enoyl-ACP reductase [Gammaproteobacteria bacterium]
MGFLANKHALIVGVLNQHSIAYGIAKAMAREGAKLAFTYQNEKVKERVKKVADEFNSKILLPCDVTHDEEITAVFEELQNHWEGLDIIVHSLAFAPSDQLDGDYIDCVTREGFRIAHDISAYSFAALAKAGRSMMKGRNASMVTVTFQGSERVVPHYNVMGVAKASLEANMRYMASSLGPEDGIRVNAVSAGPVRTLAASGIKHFRKLLEFNEMFSALRKNVTSEDVGNTAAFLCSDLAAGITGEIVHVDGGFHSVAMVDLDLEQTK